MKRTSEIFLVILFLFGCGSESEVETEPENKVTIVYEESAEDFPNPERGFYRYSETSGSQYSALSESVLKSFRTSKNSSGATYQSVSTLLFRYYILDTFKDGPISESFINQAKGDYITARNAGVKIIPRFTYTVDTNDGCNEGICPPYGDAPKAIVLGHIEQLKPIFQENADVIACVQMGFIGIWGEQYYTDYFGDASSSGQGKLLDENWQDRIDVLSALLEAVPTDIMVQVRYPQIKQRYIYGISATVNSAALTEAEAFTESDKARIAYHNDCLLASSDDYGTYTDYGNSSSPRKSATTVLRQYFSEDSKYLAVGGETCSDGYSPQNDCEPEGKAQEELSTMHYSYLNADYNNSVNNDWVTGGCMEDITKKLGYRFVLKTGEYPHTVNAGEVLSVKIDLENVGYASPFKARPVMLILRNKSTDEEYEFAFDTDIRKWFTGSLTLDGSFELDSDLEKGEYEMFINFPDKSESISSRFEYSIRLANTEVWEESTGFNKLNHTLSIL